MNGDCDWAAWDATINNTTPTCQPTASRTATKAHVLRDDVPVAFENNGELIVTFVDTIGAAGEFQVNVVFPASFTDGEQPIPATYGGVPTQSGTLITVQQ